MLQVEGIKKSFGGNEVLKGVTFSVGEGEVLGVVGPNGSGKTTLLNVISGVLKASGGRILFEGKDITALRPSKRAKLGIGRTFQITRLFSNLTVLENVLIPLHYGSPEEPSEERAKEIIEAVGLSHKIKEKAGSLSLAQRKRLELARALALKPKILLLDEIFAGLNPVSINEILTLLKELNRELKVTLVLVEHVLKALFRLTERVIVLSEGKIIFDGHPEEMKENREVIKAYLGERYEAFGS